MAQEISALTNVSRKSAHDFAKCWLFFVILLSSDSAVNLQQSHH